MPDVLEQVREAGHTVFERGRYNVNIVGVRTPFVEPDSFDDWLHVVYRDDRDQWVDLCFKCTPAPGLYYLRKPMNVNGTAILKPGQYRGAYTLGLHRGQYTALIQSKPVTVYRDRNKDAVVDQDAEKTERGLFGINIHHAGTDSKVVGRWSAGCTVVANLQDWETFLSIIRRSADSYGERFTYTLIEGR